MRLQNLTMVVNVNQRTPSGSKVQKFGTGFCIGRYYQQRSYQTKCNTHNKLTSLIVQMCKEKIGLHNVFHLQEVPAIEDSRGKCRQKTKPLNSFILQRRPFSLAGSDTDYGLESPKKRIDNIKKSWTSCLSLLNSRMHHAQQKRRALWKQRRWQASLGASTLRISLKSCI